MASFPPLGSVTICEINRNLFTADALSDDQAKDTYGKILGRVFGPVPFQSDQLPAATASPGEEEEEAEQQQQQGRASDGESVQRKSPVKVLEGLFNDFVKRIFYPNYVNLLPEVDLQGVSWHQHKHIVAFIAGPNQVAVRDYEDSERRDASILTSESQRDIKALEWRPNGGKSLAVACKGGICIWASSSLGNAPSIRSGSTSYFGTLSRSSGTRWTVVDFLRVHSDEQISALSWSPDGRYPNKRVYSI